MEAWSSGHVESPVGYHSWIAGFLTCGPESGRGTLLDGQFDWGGRLQKSNALKGQLSMDGNHAMSVNV